MKKIILFLLIFSSLAAAPKAIVFDLNGVMVQEPDREMIYPFLHETLHLCSKTEFDRVYQVILSGRFDKDFWRSLAKEKKVQLSASWGNDFRTIMKNSLMKPQMYALVNRLKEKQIQVVLFSNMEKDIASRFQELGFFEPFDLCVFAYETGVSKPDPEAYRILLKKLDLDAQDIIFIDDDPENIKASQALGIKSIIFQSPSQLEELLLKGGDSSVAFGGDAFSKKSIAVGAELHN